jgi:hypothetical protein
MLLPLDRGNAEMSTSTTTFPRSTGSPSQHKARKGNIDLKTIGELVKLPFLQGI